MIDQDEIEARLARFTVTRDGRAVWPDVSPASFRAAQREVARVTTAVLTGSPGPVPLCRSPGIDATALAVGAFAAGMSPLIAYWCEQGSVAATGEIAERLALALSHGRQRGAELQRALQMLLVELAKGNVEACVCRGTHVRE